MTKDTLPARIKAHNARRGQTANETAGSTPRGNRDRALELAITASDGRGALDEIVKMAAAFLAFLNGEAAESAIVNV